MRSLSILPSYLSTVETWLVRIFMLLALLILAPWLLVLIYDVFLYIWRSATYELPYVGGRARGRKRPSRPSFSERPNGHKRRISLPGISSLHHGSRPKSSEGGGGGGGRTATATLTATATATEGESGSAKRRPAEPMDSGGGPAPAFHPFANNT